MPKLTKKLDKAMALARKLHKNQIRKGTDIPYLAHLLGVTSLVLENGGDEDLAIAALLHDAVEDQGGRKTLKKIRKEFGKRVARIVEDCSDTWEDPKPAWRDRKQAYLASLPTKSSESQLVSLADKVHNARAIAEDYHELGDDVWSRFNGDKEGTLWYYGELVQIFSEVKPGRLTDALTEAYERMKR